MIDYRYLYLLRIKKQGAKIKAQTDIAVQLPFAGWHERRLHRRFASDRYSDVRAIPKHQYLQRICKIGISMDAEGRRVQFERNPESGKTETFAFTPGQQAAARNLIVGYWLSWQLIRWGGVAVVTLWLLSEPWR
jgi:hypothetical protein